MNTNELPLYDMSDNPTGCCPRFKPEPWDGQDIHLDNMRFVKAQTRNLFHIPLNFGTVFGRVMDKLVKADAIDPNDYVALTRDPSLWRSEHYFRTDKEIEGEETAALSGDFLTKVFDGPFKDAGKWVKELEQLARDSGKELKDVYFFYTTCPKCAETYGHNYVFGFAQV